MLLRWLVHLVINLYLYLDFKNSLDNIFSSQKDQNLYFIQASCKSLGEIDEIDTKKQEKFEKYKRFLDIVRRDRSTIFADTEFSAQSKFSNLLDKF